VKQGQCQVIEAFLEVERKTTSIVWQEGEESACAQLRGRRESAAAAAVDSEIIKLSHFAGDLQIPTLHFILILQLVCAVSERRINEMTRTDFNLQFPTSSHTQYKFMENFLEISST
jgi:hypothetical protein